ncbi:MAG: AI-2E family transporter [Spirochaetes bacterium]|nr:MAG: AI-2E family transporter [Spirochaetota bacterium]
MVKKDSYLLIQRNKRLKLLFLALFVSVIIGLAFIFRYYFWPFLFAFVLYVSLKPIHDAMLRVLKKSWLSSSLLIVLLFVVVMVPAFLLLFTLANQSFEFYQYIQKQFDPKIFDDFLHKSEIMKTAYAFLNITEGELVKKTAEVLQSASLALFSNLTDVLSFSIRFTVNFFFMFLILYFLFTEGKRFGALFYKLMPFPSDIEKSVVSRLKEVIKVLMVGNMLIMVLQGILLGVGFGVAGLAAPLLWGSIAAILSLIPVVGTSIIWMPAAAALVISGNVFWGVFVGTWCFSGYMLLENLLKPKLLGDKLAFHPLIFFFLLLGSIQAFNLPGVIVGPLLLTLFYSFWEIYRVLEDYDRSCVEGAGPGTEKC